MQPPKTSKEWSLASCHCPEKTDASNTRAEALGRWPSKTAALARCCSFLHFLHTPSISINYDYEAQTQEVFVAHAFSFRASCFSDLSHTISRRYIYDKGHRRASVMTVMTYYVFQTVWHQKDSEWLRVRMTSKLESLKSLWLQQTHVTRGLSRFSSLSGWGVHSNRWMLFMCQAELLTYNEHNKSSFVLFGLFQNVDAFVVCSPWSCLVSFGVVKKEIISCNFWKLSHHSFPAAAFRAVHVESNPPVRMHPKYSCTSQQLLRLTALQFVDTHPSAGSLLRCSTSATGSRKTHLVKF
jgi:hypothetical protein